jgi:ABC-2 type transport system ATP-binding protein
MTYTEPALETEGLRKAYRSTTVLDGVDLAVEQGSVFALLGPNGAGKTTTVRILATLTGADAGRARVAGFDVRRQRRQVRRRISLTGQFTAVDDGQTGRENLTMVGRLAGLSRPDARHRAGELLDRFELADAGDRRVATWSGGMRRRLDLAAGLVAAPEVIFLDEPTTGLDPRSRQQTWQFVADLAGAGTTVFLTTQYLEEADRLADRIAVLDAGRIVAQGSAAQLKQQVGEQRIDLVATGPEAYGALLAGLGDRATRVDADQLTLGAPTDGSAAHVRGLLDELDPHRDAVASFALHAASLDDAFLALTGRSAGRPDRRPDRRDDELEPSHA